MLQKSHSVHACMQAWTGCCKIIHHRLHPPNLKYQLLHVFFPKKTSLQCISVSPVRYIIWMHEGNLWWNSTNSCCSVHLGTRCTQWMSGAFADDACRALPVDTPPAWIQPAGTGAQETHSLCWRVFVAAMGVNTSKFVEVLFPASLH